MLTLLTFRDSTVRRSRLQNELNRSTTAKRIFAGIAACCAMGLASDVSAENEVNLHAPLNSTLKVSTAKTNWTKRDSASVSPPTESETESSLVEEPSAAVNLSNDKVPSDDAKDQAGKGSIQAIPASGPLDRFRKATRRTLPGSSVGDLSPLGVPVPSGTVSGTELPKLSNALPKATATPWQNRTASQPLDRFQAGSTADGNSPGSAGNSLGSAQFRPPVQEGAWIARDAVNRIAPLRDPAPVRDPAPLQLDRRSAVNTGSATVTDADATSRSETALDKITSSKLNVPKTQSSSLNDSWAARNPRPKSSTQAAETLPSKALPSEKQTTKSVELEGKKLLASPLANRFGTGDSDDRSALSLNAASDTATDKTTSRPTDLTPESVEPEASQPGSVESTQSSIHDAASVGTKADIASRVMKLNESMPVAEKAAEDASEVAIDPLAEQDLLEDASDKILKGPLAELEQDAKKSVSSAAGRPRSVELQSPRNEKKIEIAEESDSGSAMAELKAPQRTPFRPESEAAVSIARRTPSRGSASSKVSPSAPRKLERPRSAKPLASESASGRVGDLETEVPAAKLDYTGRPASEVRPTRSVVSMRRGIERTLQYFYDRPEIATGRSNWGMMHALMVYGIDTKVIVGRKKFSAVAWIAGNNNCRGQRLLTNDPDGILAKSGAGLQGHQGQFLAVLGMCNVPLDYPLHAGKVKYTVRDLLEAEKRACKTGEELTFTLIGLSHYIDTDSSWIANDGTRWDFQRLLSEELKQPIVGAACGGTHRLMGYSHALRKRRVEGKPIEGHWKRAEVYTDDFINYAYSLQNRDGSMSTKWFEGRADNGNVDRKIQTTGHIVEWLLTLTPDDELQNPRLIRAVNFLSRNMGADLRHDWSIGPKGHALRSLAMYHQRVFQEGSPWVSRGKPQVANGGSGRYR